MNKLALLIATILPCIRLSAAVPENPEGFVPLFNGHDLTGWVPVNVPVGTFSVHDGVIVTTGKEKGYLRTERAYENFVIEFDWQIMVGAGNTGFFVWTDREPAVGAPYPRGFEIQILDPGYSRLHADGANVRFTTDGDIIPIRGGVMTPDGKTDRSGKRSFPSESRTRPSPAWNHYRVECNRGEVHLSVNGKEVSVARNCTPRLGYLCLESEDGEAHFKDIRIRELPSANPPTEQRARL